MEALELQATARQITGKQSKQLRQQGLVPAVLYGKNFQTKLLQIEVKTLHKVLAEAGTHRLILLRVDNERPQMTLVREIQRDTIKRNCIHVDFYAVKMDEKITAQVPVVFEGVSPAVKDLGGILTQGLAEIEIECLPADLVSAVEVDVSSLGELNDTITVADLKVPRSITILSDPESMVAKVEPPRTQEALEAELAPTVAEPQVLTAAKEKAKEEEEKEEE